MRTYLILLLLIAIAIPMTIKFGILSASNAPTGGAAPGPCMLNNNFDNFSNDSLQDRILPKNLDKMTKPDAFQTTLDNRPNEHMINMDGFQEDRSDRVGQNCQFGQCTPGAQQQPTNNVEFE